MIRIVYCIKARKEKSICSLSLCVVQDLRRARRVCRAVMIDEWTVTSLVEIIRWCKRSFLCLVSVYHLFCFVYLRHRCLCWRKSDGVDDAIEMMLARDWTMSGSAHPSCSKSICSSLCDRVDADGDAAAVADDDGAFPYVLMESAATAWGQWLRLWSCWVT